MRQFHYPEGRICRCQGTINSFASCSEAGCPVPRGNRVGSGIGLPLCTPFTQCCIRNVKLVGTIVSTRSASPTVQFGKKDVRFVKYDVILCTQCKPSPSHQPCRQEKGTRWLKNSYTQPPWSWRFMLNATAVSTGRVILDLFVSSCAVYEMEWTPTSTWLLSHSRSV